MLERLRTAVSKTRLRPRELNRRHARHRTLRAEPLEGRLLMTGDSWVLDTNIPLHTDGSGNTSIPVAADDEGSAYVGATRREGAATEFDVCLTKYSSDGTRAWTNLLQFPGYQYITDVAVGPDGVYIVGGFEGTVNFDPAGSVGGQFTSLGGQDGYLAKYGTDGEFLWAHQWGGTGSDRLQGVAVSAGAVYVTGRMDLLVRNKVQTEQLVASVSSDGLLVRWEETVGLLGGAPSDIAVFTSPSEPSAPASIYTFGAAGGVRKLIETADGRDTVLAWTLDVGGITGYGALAVGTADNNGSPESSLYVLADHGLKKISDTGTLLWSTPVEMDAYPWGVGVDGATVYVTGMFTEQADFGGALLTSRGNNDGFLARYTGDGDLLSAQRMGGSGIDKWYSVAVGNDRVYAAGFSNSTNGDFATGLPGQLSAFVPADPLGEVIVMQLDTAAPIVQVAEADISVAPNTPVTLSATTNAGTITWYESGNAIGTGINLTVTLGLGIHQISAIATDDAGLIGMAGVVVTVAAPTKFYVVDDATANQTFEYSAAGALNESYSLNTANTAPRGAASTVAGDTTWVVDANRNVYVYNTSGGLLRSWTAGTLNSKSVVEGLATNGTDVWIVDSKTDKVYRYANGANVTSGTLTAASSFSLNAGNLSPKDIVTDGASIWVVNDSTTDAVFKYSMTGAYLGNWTISGGGGSPTGITIDPASVSNIWIVDSVTDRIYQFNSAAGVTSGTLTPSVTFALAAGNTNPQGIADPPAPSSLVTTEEAVLAESAATEAAWRDRDAAFHDLYYYEPPRTGRMDHALRRVARSAVLDLRAADFPVWAAPGCLTGDTRRAVDNDSQADRDDLFAQWDSDPLQLLTLP